MPHFKCCVCGVSDRADETRLPKRARRLPLVPRPEVLLLEFATQHTTVCQACARANGRSVAAALRAGSPFRPQTALDLLRQGAVDMAKLIVRALPPASVMRHRDAATGGNAFHLAAKGGYFQMAHFLLFRRRTRKWAAAHPAVVVREASADPKNHLFAANNSSWRDTDEDQELLAVTNAHGLTPLGVACATSGREDFVRLFLAAGADPHFLHRTAHDTTTLIMLACVSGQTRAIQELQRHGARVNDRSPKDGRTALMVASSLAQVEVVKTLLECGARPEMVDHAGVSALDRASKRVVLDPGFGSICSVLIHALSGGAAGPVQGPRPGRSGASHSAQAGSNIGGGGPRAGKSSAASSSSLANLAEARKTSLSSGHAKFGYRARRKRLFAKKWQEYYDSLSEAPYWWHPDTEETTWELPEHVVPSEWTRRWLEEETARREKTAAEADTQQQQTPPHEEGALDPEEGNWEEEADEDGDDEASTPLATEPGALRSPTTTAYGTTSGAALLAAAAAGRLSPQEEKDAAAAAFQRAQDAAAAHEKEFLTTAQSEAFQNEFAGHYAKVETQVRASAALERHEQRAEIEARNLRMQQAAVAATGTVVSSDWRAQRDVVLRRSEKNRQQTKINVDDAQQDDDGGRQAPQLKLREVFPEIPLRVRERRRMPNPELDYKDGLLTAVVRTQRNKRRQARILETRRKKETLPPALARAATIKAAEDAAKAAAKTVLVYGPRSAKTMLQAQPAPPTTFSSGDPRNTGTMTRTEEEATDGIELGDAALRKDSDFDLPRDFVEGGNTLFLPEEGVVEVSVWPGEYKRGGMGGLSSAAGRKVRGRGGGEGEAEEEEEEVVTLDYRDTRLYSKRAGRYATQAEEMVGTMMKKALVSSGGTLPSLDC